MNEVTTSEQVTPPVVPQADPEIAAGNGTTPPTDKPEPKTPEFMSEKFAALARKEKAIVKARQEIAALKADVEKQQLQLNERLQEFDKWKKLKENAKLDPDSYLNEAGLSYGYLTERALKGEKTDGNEILAKARAEIEALRKENSERDKKLEESQKTQAQRDWEERVSNFVAGITDFVNQNKETYELIDLHGQQDLIWQVIQEGARRQQSITVKEAADKVEAYLGEQVDRALTGSKKFKEKYELKKVEEKPKEPGSPTLNNSLNTTTPVNPGIITDAERTQRALAALNKALGE